MERQEKNALIAKLAQGRDAQNMPIAKGTVLTFPKGTMEPKEEPGINGGNPWCSFNSQEGHRISLTQLTRRGNGLVFADDKTTVEARALALLDMNDNQDVTLQVRDRVVMESTSREGKNAYLVFNNLNIA